jgi:hypothetical protein
MRITSDSVLLGLECLLRQYNARCTCAASADVGTRFVLHSQPSCYVQMAPTPWIESVYLIHLYAIVVIPLHSLGELDFCTTATCYPREHPDGLFVRAHVGTCRLLNAPEKNKRPALSGFCTINAVPILRPMHD